MAKLVDSPEAREMSASTGKSFSDFMKHQTAVLNRLEEKAEALPDGQIVGALIDFAVADGKAIYLVVNDSPLQLSHLPYGDGYAVHPALIKGLDRSDVLQQVKRAKAFGALFKPMKPATT